MIMKIKILFFGIARDITNNSSMDLEIHKDANVANILELLVEKYPKLKGIHEFSIAVNEEYSQKDMVLRDRDVVAIIPPVSGG